MKPRRRAGRARVDVAVRATTLSRLHDGPATPRRHVGARARGLGLHLSVLGPPAGGTPRAGDAVVHIGVSTPPTGEPPEDPAPPGICVNLLAGPRVETLPRCASGPRSSRHPDGGGVSRAREVRPA